MRAVWRTCESRKGDPAASGLALATTYRTASVMSRGLELRVLPFVHHAVHAAVPTIILAEMAPMVSPHRAAVIMPVAPAMPLRAFQVAYAPMMMRAQQPRELLKPRLLRVVQAGIERLAGLGDVLEGCACLGHVVGALCQLVERRARRLIGILFRRFARGDSLGAQLRHVAQSLLEVRPVLGLIGRELETGPECGNAGVDERRPVLRAQPMPMLKTLAVSIRPAEMLLGIDD